MLVKTIKGSSSYYIICCKEIPIGLYGIERVYLWRGVAEIFFIFSHNTQKKSIEKSSRKTPLIKI